MQVKKQQLEQNMEQQIGSKLRKEYVKAVYSPCLFNLYAEYIRRNTRLDESWAGTNWGKISTASRYADDTTLMANSEEELKSLLRRMKEESEKAGLKFNIQKMKIMASNAITSWQIDGKKLKQWQTLFSLAPKWLWMVTAAMKVKDACSLEEKLWQI